MGVAVFLNESWIPTDDIWLERSFLDGAFLGTTAYGITLVLAIMSFRALFARTARKVSWDLVAYVFLVFALSTIGNGTAIKNAEMSFVDYRNFPGGPSAFEGYSSPFWVDLVGYGAYIIGTWLQDGLVLWRFLVVFNFSWTLAALPILMYLATIVTSSILLAQLNQPDSTLATSINMALPYWSISIGLNILLSLAIVARIFSLRRDVRKALGQEHGAMYTGVAAMLVESAAVYSITGLIFIITYARNSNVQNLAQPVLGQAQSISPLLIILRVAEGRAWSRNTLKSPTEGRSAIQFSDTAVRSTDDEDKLPSPSSMHKPEVPAV